MFGVRVRRGVRRAKPRAACSLVLLALACAGCGTGVITPENVQEEIDLTSPAFDDGAAIPREHTCDGRDVPPRLEWAGGPEAAEYALVVLDPGAGDFVHWTVFGIPGSARSLDPGSLPATAKEGANGFNRFGYGGPCPPRGDPPHAYEFTLFALASKESGRLRPAATPEEVLRVIECCLRAKGTLTGTYGR